MEHQRKQPLSNVLESRPSLMRGVGFMESGSTRKQVTRSPNPLSDGAFSEFESTCFARRGSRVQIPPSPPCTTRSARVHADASSLHYVPIFPRVVHALNPSEARGSGLEMRSGI